MALAAIVGQLGEGRLEVVAIGGVALLSGWGLRGGERRGRTGPGRGEAEGRRLRGGRRHKVG